MLIVTALQTTYFQTDEIDETLFKNNQDRYSGKQTDEHPRFERLLPKMAIPEKPFLK